MIRSSEKNRSLWKSITVILIVFLIISSVLLFSYHPGFLFYSATAFTSPALELDDFGKETTNIYNYFRMDKVNIALLGFDGSEYRDGQHRFYRPDTIMIASIDLKAKQVSLVSIPRDSYVQIHGTDIHDKINHSYLHGYRGSANGIGPHMSGLEITLNTIQSFLGGVTIHHYIVLDIDAASDIIDEIGGVYYDVEFEVRTRLGEGRLLVEPGQQLLDGKKFMDYVRNRASPQGGEHGRIERQQSILIALLDQFKKEGRLMELPNLYKSVQDIIETDLNIVHISALSIFGSQVDPAEIKTYVFSGSGQLSYQDGQNIWYLVIDEEKRVSIIREAFGEVVEERPQLELPGPYIPEPAEAREKPKPEPAQEDEMESEPWPEPAQENEAENEPVPDSIPGSDQDINDHEDENEDSGENAIEVNEAETETEN